ncbi:MAG: Ornithine cyclodeaminase [Chloroflexi bacterium]|nr:Ornithine cyclodeaminase [Chloroflexota bacterium]
MANSPTSGVLVRTNALDPGAEPPRDSYVNLVFDPNDGRLLAMLAGEDMNVFRTGLPAGLGARYMASNGATTLAMLGSGRQAPGQAAAIRHALPDLRQIRVFSPTPAHRARFADEMAARLGIMASAVDSAREAIEDADVVDVCTSATEPVFETTWVRPGALVITVSAGVLPSDLVTGSRVVVAASREIGSDSPREPYTSLIKAGAWGPDSIVADFAEVLQGAAVRQSSDDTVIFEMHGMSAWDVALNRWAYDSALARGVGTAFHLS